MRAHLSVAFNNRELPKTATHPVLLNTPKGFEVLVSQFIIPEKRPPEEIFVGFSIVGYLVITSGPIIIVGNQLEIGGM